MNISWFYLIKVKFSGHFWPYTLSAPSCTWFLMISMSVGLNLFILSWILVPICAPVKFLTCFPTWANNRNLIFQAKLQNSLCSCTSWGYMCNTNEICDTYPESSWYKLLKNARKSWNNHKSYCTILDNFGQKYPKTDTVDLLKKILTSQLGKQALKKIRKIIIQLHNVFCTGNYLQLFLSLEYVSSSALTHDVNNHRANMICTSS